ncbi:hypothetical protein FH972_000516 [Carpinus fangiana]|uniref:Uncharacterized protein n=1 Tax=Carpinus fangiana TaxID=176857 RepID=A0A5N6Q927_9ROSI|nr:hypothetical protein FH972_000516 [Carpinus fangiana]
MHRNFPVPVVETSTAKPVTSWLIAAVNCNPLIPKARVEFGLTDATWGGCFWWTSKARLTDADSATTLLLLPTT